MAKSTPEQARQEFLNRDKSLLEFIRRVLDQAQNPMVPLLERVRFLSIFETIVDEFFMKRVGHLKRLRESGKGETNPDRRSVTETIEECRTIVQELQSEGDRCYRKEILPALKSNGIHLLDYKDLSSQEKSEASEYFQSKVFPILTPLAVDPAHPFPFLSNLSVSIGIKIRRPKTKETLFARIKIPDVLPQWIELKSAVTGNEKRMIRLLDLVQNHLEGLFPEMSIEKVIPFRVTRNADIDPSDDEVEDLMDLVEEELRERRLARVVRVEFQGEPDPWIKDLLLDELELDETDIYLEEGELNYLTLKDIASLDRPELKYRPWFPVAPKALSEEKADVFSMIRSGDVLVHHPYESFNASVEKFVRAAATDPKVLAIKMTLYRTEEKSPFVPLLIQAAESGIQVVCVVELKARFDEARNIYWGEMLEKAGVHVVYGVVGLKTHTKCVLVVRNEADGFRFYGHVGTGNYNSVTARLYTDLGLITCDPKMTSEMIEVFNYLTGLSLKRNYKKFLVAPINMKSKFLDAIKKEIEAKKQKKPARIIAKMNSLEDAQMIRALYEASQAGVEIDLIVRGFCCLRPGVKGLSENIRVTSIIGRFLEHSRIYYFQNGKKDPVEGRFFISSADWMSRNLDSRVETAIPVESEGARKKIWSILEVTLKDDHLAWKLNSDGRYSPPPKSRNAAAKGSQAKLMKIAKGE